MSRKVDIPILIVDDDTSVCSYLKVLFQEEGHQVFTASNGERALELLQHFPCSVVLLDLTLPGMSGSEVLVRIKEKNKNTEVIMITGHATVDSTLEALRNGAYDYLVKPFDLDHVLLTVGKAIDKQRLIMENAELNTDLKGKVKRLSILNELGKAMHSILDLQELLDFFVELVADVLGAKRVSLMLKDNDTGDLLIRSSIGMDENVAKSVRVGPGQGVAGRVIKEGQPLLIEDVNDDDQFQETGNQGYSADSFISAPLILAVPIQLKKEILGVINVSNKEALEPFLKDDLEFLAMLASHAAHALENARMFEELREVNDKLEKANLETIMALADALEAKDALTKGHSDRTVEYALEIAAMLGLSEKEKNDLQYAAVLHDIGKIGISENILNKPAKLTDEEFELMKSHPVMGAGILKKISFLEPVARLVKAHHERFDGRGYPDGLAGEAIPIESRIVAILDAFDAMTSDRPYRKAPGVAFAINELRRYAGTQFDPAIVEIFISILEKDLLSDEDSPLKVAIR